MSLNQSGFTKKTYSSTNDETGNGLKSSNVKNKSTNSHFIFQKDDRPFIQNSQIYQQLKQPNLSTTVRIIVKVFPDLLPLFYYILAPNSIY